MAESRQFGGGRVFGDKRPGSGPGASDSCAQCEAMLTDALDGTLSAADQAIFDLHAESCAACGQIVADARRGVAWLEILRHPAPVPPADLLERILAQTSGLSPDLRPNSVAADGIGEGALAQGYALGEITGGGTRFARVIPFPQRAVASLRRSAFGQVVLQPRLAMTAAMAFFSVALTMNITGIHPASLRASDLTPSSLRRDVISADTHVVRYYESLRVVYELESRVHDLQSSQDTDLPAATAPMQEDQPTARPAGQAPAAQPMMQPDEPKAQPQPAGKRPAPSSGTSRRDELNRPRRFVVSEALDASSIGTGIDKRERIERRLV